MISRAPSPTHPASVPAYVSPANEPLVHATSHLVHTVSHVEHPAAHKPHEHETHVTVPVPAPVAAPAPAPAPAPVHHKHHDPPALSHPPETNTNSAAVSAKYYAAQTNYKLAHTAAAHSDDKAVDKRLTELNKALDNKIGRGDFDQLKSMVQELMYTSMTRARCWTGCSGPTTSSPRWVGRAPTAVGVWWRWIPGVECRS